MDTPFDPAALSGRLRQVRLELFGLNGAPEMARRLGLPTRTWLNYESGIIISVRALLTFLILTDVEPAWLTGGGGPVYRPQGTTAERG